MHERHRRQVLIHCPLTGLSHQALGACLGNGLHANAAVFANLATGHVLDQGDNGLGHVTAPLKVVACVHVFGIFTKDHKIDLVCRLIGAGHTLEISNGTHAGVQVHALTHAHVDRTKTRCHTIGLAAAITGLPVKLLMRTMQTHKGLFANGRGKRALDCDLDMLDRINDFLGQHILTAIGLQGLQARINRAPLDLTGAVIGLGHSSLDHILHHRRDINANTIPAEQPDDRSIANDQFSVLTLD